MDLIKKTKFKNPYEKIFHVIHSCDTIEQLTSVYEWIDRVDLSDVERIALKTHVEEWGLVLEKINHFKMK